MLFLSWQTVSKETSSWCPACFQFLACKFHHCLFQQLLFAQEATPTLLHFECTFHITIYLERSFPQWHFSLYNQIDFPIPPFPPFNYLVFSSRPIQVRQIVQILEAYGQEIQALSGQTPALRSELSLRNLEGAGSDCLIDDVTGVAVSPLVLNEDCRRRTRLLSMGLKSPVSYIFIDSI